MGSRPWPPLAPRLGAPPPVPPRSPARAWAGCASVGPWADAGSPDALPAFAGEKEGFSIAHADMKNITKWTMTLRQTTCPTTSKQL